MPKYRLCKRFVVESGHMLSKHPERCRYPHGHTRTIEVVVAGEALNANGMLVDFKALKLALKDYLDRFDHAMAVNSEDPLLPVLKQMYPDEAIVVFDGQEPTTEAMAKHVFDFGACVLNQGFRSDDGLYEIKPRQARLERVRVWETPDSWAEYEL